MKTGYIILAIAVSAAVTFALRALPFAAFRGDRAMPAWLERLGRTLPSAIMAVLVVYCLKGAAADFVGRACRSFWPWQLWPSATSCGTAPSSAYFSALARIWR